MQIQPPDKENKYIIFALIFMLSNQLQTIGDSFFEEISTKQWFILLMLSAMGDYVPTLTELSEAVGSSHQNVKQLVLKLEQRGYVEIKKDEEDGRRLRIKATPKCGEFHTAYEQKSAKFMNKMFGNLKEKDLDITLKVMLSLKDTVKGMEKDYVR